MTNNASLSSPNVAPSSIPPNAEAGQRIPVRRAKRFLAILVSVILIVLAAISTLNFFLDPLHFSSSGLRTAANEMRAGKNYAIYDANIDFRGLRREAIAAMTTTPDVIIFAGSRFELADATLFPGRTFYNSFVHNDFFEDLLAISEILYANNRLPKNLVLSVRYKTFLPLDPSFRETEEYKNFWREYQTMSGRLGIDAAPQLEIFPFAYWSQLLSVSNIKRQVAFLAQGKRQGPVEQSVLDDMEVLHPDGSIAFSKAHTASFASTINSRGDKSASTTANTGKKDAEQRAVKMSKRKEWPLDSQRIEAFGRLLAFLKQHGSSVSIAITPHHPAYWQGIQGSPYEKSISAMEARVREIAIANDATVVGSLDPEKAGCPESSIRDFIHLELSCLKVIFDQIPLKN